MRQLSVAFHVPSTKLLTFCLHLFNVRTSIIPDVINAFLRYFKSNIRNHTTILLYYINYTNIRFKSPSYLNISVLIGYIKYWFSESINLFCPNVFYILVCKRKMCNGEGFLDYFQSGLRSLRCHLQKEQIIVRL